MPHDTLDEHPASHYLEAEWRLFQAFEAGEAGLRWLFWESTRPAVIVGRNTRVDDHVHLEACSGDGVAVLRRCSGGGTVALGPGCLNYAVVASFDDYPSLGDVPSSFQFILGRIVAALQVPGLAVVGGTDIALVDRKVSGSAQRRGRRALLHHGTLLYAFDPAFAARYLREPPRQPAYRNLRRHADFVGNLPLTKTALESRVTAAFRDLIAPLRAQR